MHALYLPGGRRVAVREVEVPRPGPDEVLVAIKAAGLCGSDLHMHYRPAPEERHGPVFGLVTDPDIVPGHEPAGVVAEVGREVVNLRVNDRVAIHHMAGCGNCMSCRSGWDINCQKKWGTYGLDRPGAMQDFMVARSRDCVTVPENIGFPEAAYITCGAGTGYLALKRAGFGLGDTVAVVGLGPVGLAAGYFAALAGARVIGVDTVEERCNFARLNGFGVACNPSDDDAKAVARAATAGRGADVVLETSGSAAGRVLALEIAAVGSRVVCVGFAESANIIDVQAQIIQKQLDVRGAWMFSLPDLQRLLDDISLRNISLRHLISATYDIEDGTNAWETFDRGAPGKTVLSWADNDQRT